MFRVSEYSEDVDFLSNHDAGSAGGLVPFLTRWGVWHPGVSTYTYSTVYYVRRLFIHLYTPKEYTSQAVTARVHGQMAALHPLDARRSSSPPRIKEGIIVD